MLSRPRSAKKQRGSVTKRYDEPIDVTSDPFEPGAPIAFRWRGRHYEIDRSLSSWLETRMNGTRRDREYHRLLARPAGVYATGDLDADGSMCSVGAVYDVYRDRVAGAWKLARVWD